MDITNIYNPKSDINLSGSAKEDEIQKMKSLQEFQRLTYSNTRTTQRAKDDVEFGLDPTKLLHAFYKSPTSLQKSYVTTRGSLVQVIEDENETQSTSITRTSGSNPSSGPPNVSESNY